MNQKEMQSVEAAVDALFNAMALHADGCGISDAQKKLEPVKDQALRVLLGDVALAPSA